MLNIRKQRVLKGITQRQAASKINVTPECISAWERDMGEPKLRQGLKLAKFYGCKPESLIGGVR
jgi:DNA-binding XRE family transcriptional regulator